MRKAVIRTKGRTPHTRNLLVLAGKRKSGKDVFISYVLKHYPGFRHYRIAEGPNRIAEFLELPIDRRIQHALFGVNALLYPVLGESAYKRRVAVLLDRERPKAALVEAVRTREEYNEFVKKRGGALVGVRAPDRLRYERALMDFSNRKKEKRDEGKMSFREFMDKERSPIEREIDWIVGRADFILDNTDNNHREYYRKIDGIMEKLGFRKK